MQRHASAERIFSRWIGAPSRPARATRRPASSGRVASMALVRVAENLVLATGLHWPGRARALVAHREQSTCVRLLNRRGSRARPCWSTVPTWRVGAARWPHVGDFRNPVLSPAREDNCGWSAGRPCSSNAGHATRRAGRRLRGTGHAAVSARRSSARRAPAVGHRPALVYNPNLCWDRRLHVDPDRSMIGAMAGSWPPHDDHHRLTAVTVIRPTESSAASGRSTGGTHPLLGRRSTPA